jgi:small membrane protein
MLIAATSGVLLLLLQRRAAARTRASKRLILVALVTVAIISILNPDLTTRAASLVGVGRGTDLLLYVLTAVFLYVVVGFYLKFKDVERQITVLARRIALDEAAARPRPEVSGSTSDRAHE